MNFLEKLLDYYNISTKEYEEIKREPSLADVPSFSYFDNIKEVSEKIQKAIKENKKILIYGDYDADGILATSILVNTFKKLKYEVDYYIPSRYLDGYGINKDKVLQAKEKGYQLIITVDNGIVAFDAIKTAKEIGIDMIITDHHEFKEVPKEFLCLHPKLSRLTVTTSGAMVAFYLSTALLFEIDPYLLTLGATSILSDAMPMKGENRYIVKLALKYLNKYKFDKFKLLSGETNFDESILNLNVIPKINAVGRIETNKEVNILVKYFTCDSYHDLVSIREYLNKINDKRKTMSNDIVKALDIKDEEAVILKLDILSGLTGLIASRVVSSYNLPVAIFSSEVKDGNIRGSIRSKHGLNVTKFFEENLSLLIEYGGHEFAGGVVIKENDFPKFKEAFLSYSKLHKFIPSQDNIEITEDDVTLENYNLIRSLSPFGNEWKEPTFIIKGIDVNRINKMGNEMQHLSITLNNKNRIIGFNYPFNLINQDTINVNGVFRLNKYKDYQNVNLLIQN